MKSYLIGLGLILVCFSFAAPLGGDVMDRYYKELSKRGEIKKLAVPKKPAIREIPAEKQTGETSLIELDESRPMN